MTSDVEIMLCWLLKDTPSQDSLVLDGLLHSTLLCGQSTTSSFCQASLPRCASTQSQLLWASGICCCRPNCLELTERWSVWSVCVSLTVSDVWLKLGCFHSTSTYSALDVSQFMCYINSCLTDWLTYRALCDIWLSLDSDSLIRCSTVWHLALIGQWLFDPIAALCDIWLSLDSDSLIRLLHRNALTYSWFVERTDLSV